MPYKDTETRRKARRKSYLERKDKILAQERQYRAENPERFRQTKIKHRYGISQEQYLWLWNQQGGKCAICLARTASHIDHCHTTMKVRGLLCVGCNNGLGQFGDNIAGLERALAYLHRTENGIDLPVFVSEETIIIEEDLWK